MGSKGLRSVEDFILFLVRNGRANTKNEVLKKLGIFGFEVKEIKQAQLMLIANGKLKCKGNTISIA